MRKVMMLCCLFVLNANFLDAYTIRNHHATFGAAAIATVCIAGTIIVQKTVIPFITNRKEEQQRKYAYEFSRAVHQKHENLEQTIKNLSLPLLKKQIEEIKTDRELLQNLCDTIPFKKNDPTKSDKPLQEAITLLTKQLAFCERYYADSYLKKLWLSYSHELIALTTNNLTKTTVKEIVDQQYGNNSYRHQKYAEELTQEIETCRWLLEKDGLARITAEDQEKLEKLQNLLLVITELLTSELQQEIIESKEEKHKKEIHDAEVARIRNEAEYYHEKQKLSQSKQNLIKDHQTMMEDVRRTVHSIEEKMNYIHQLEQILRNIDQRGSENRIIDAVRKYTQQLHHELQSIRQRIQANSSFGPPYNPYNDGYIPPPPENPEYTAAQAHTDPLYASAPPL